MASLLLRLSNSFVNLRLDNIRLRKQNDPILRQPTKELSPEEINTDSFKQIVNKMVYVMRENCGQGLAAPQIGLNFKIIVLEFTEEDYQNAVQYYGSREVKKREMRVFPLTILVNPTLTVTDFETTVFDEGCLSLDRTTGKVRRYKQVEVEGLNENGSLVKIVADGWMARIVQHEIHHLKGLLITDYFEKPKSRSWLTR